MEADVRAFLGSDHVPTMDERYALMTNLNTERSSGCISVLLYYRLIDVTLALELGFGTFGQMQRLRIPLPLKMVREVLTFV